MEDDADWDLRIKSQMQDFARASRLLLQPRFGQAGSFLDPTNPRQSLDDQPKDFWLSSAPQTKPPTTSPYGDIDHWDVLWLGHCGARMPRPADKTIPLARVFSSDPSVPEPQHVAVEFGNRDLYKSYPHHTRAVHRAAENVCTLAYAVTLPAARRILYELSINKIDASMDLMLRNVCEGEGRTMRTCLTVQPQLFQHHRPKGAKHGFSEISNHGEGYNPTPHTLNLRWSTRVNFPKLVDGQTDYIDQYPDGRAAPKWVGDMNAEFERR